jgi:hypothetical protein
MFIFRLVNPPVRPLSLLEDEACRSDYFREAGGYYLEGAPQACGHFAR